MMKSSPLRYLLLYLPWVFALYFASDPKISYFIAWVGSFYIFYLSFTNKIIDTTEDGPITEKILKPLFLMQFIFAGYTCCTSIFYFLDQLGYTYLEKRPGWSQDMGLLDYAASCQRDYVLGHAALAHGLLLLYRTNIKTRFLPLVRNWASFFIKVAIICIPVTILFINLDGLAQFALASQGLSFVGATMAIAIAIPQRKVPIILVAGSLYGYELAQALVSGFKEPVIVSVLMIGLLLLPFYKRMVLVLFIPLLFFLFSVLPTYVASFRNTSWQHQQSSELAKREAMERVKNDLSGENIGKTNWTFLTIRLSEIEMFIKYKKGVEKRGFYGWKITQQSLESIVPRYLWPSKPYTENMAMERAFDNGIVERISVVSAKPAFLVDGYLSGGSFGVWLALFLYGVIGQFACNKAEELFGGYLVGTVLVFTALFRPMWRGDCFEFVFNYVFWSFVSMYLLAFIFRKTGILVKVKDEHELVEQPAAGTEIIMTPEPSAI